MLYLEGFCCVFDNTYLPFLYTEKNYKQKFNFLYQIFLLQFSSSEFS